MSSEFVSTLHEVVYVPLGDGSLYTSPSPPASWTTAEQLHPLPAAEVQVTVE
jgi:hypothetical protein